MATRSSRFVVLACALFGLWSVEAYSIGFAPNGTDGPEGATTAPFNIVDQVEGAFVNQNHFPVRPLVADPSGTGFFAVNTHASTVERFDGNAITPTAVWDVPWGPVAMRLWTNSTTDETQLLVSCRGSRSLAFLDMTSGEVVRLIPLPAEPADVLVLEGDLAFVACSALDTVV
jgi:hypothetical protein